MTEEMKAKMRHNVERIKVYRDKKTGATNHIPGWAKDPHGVPPGATRPKAPPQPPPRSSYHQEPPRPSSSGRTGARDPFNNADWEDFMRDAQRRARQHSEYRQKSGTGVICP